MSPKMYLKIFGYGLLLFVITMVLLFGMSIITQSEQPIDYPWAVAAVAMLMAACSRWFFCRLQAASAKQALTLGIIWALMLAGILLLIAIPNQTTEIVFGRWSTYLIFIGVAIGPLINRFA